jgi:hypothetical protein
MVVIKWVAVMVVIGKYDVVGCIVYTDEVMNGTECRRDPCLDFHTIFGGEEKDSETPLQDAKDAFNDIAS